jgi:hypothetical protein
LGCYYSLGNPRRAFKNISGINFYWNLYQNQQGKTRQR